MIIFYGKIKIWLKVLSAGVLKGLEDGLEQGSLDDRGWLGDQRSVDVQNLLDVQRSVERRRAVERE